jgi:hypothetical protein
MTDNQAVFDVVEAIRQYAALDWRNELAAVMFAKEHPATL